MEIVTDAGGEEQMRQGMKITAAWSNLMGDNAQGRRNWFYLLPKFPFRFSKEGCCWMHTLTVWADDNSRRLIGVKKWKEERKISYGQGGFHANVSPWINRGDLRFGAQQPLENPSTWASTNQQARENLCSYLFIIMWWIFPRTRHFAEVSAERLSTILAHHFLVVMPASVSTNRRRDLGNGNW